MCAFDYSEKTNRLLVPGRDRDSLSYWHFGSDGLIKQQIYVLIQIYMGDSLVALDTDVVIAVYDMTKHYCERMLPLY